MRLRSLTQAVSLATLWLSTALSAQTITGEVSTNGGASYTALAGSPFNSGTAITVNVGAVSQPTLLRFSNPTASADLGAITINGSLQDPSATLSLIVANGINTFPQIATDAIQNAGVKDVAGVTITDTALRDNTRIAIAATGSLTGPITVGHVLRRQLNSTGTGAGAIQAAITATADNNSVVTDTGLLDTNNQPLYAEPLAFIRAAKKITGAITATDGDIGIISIGLTTAQSDGLQADVKAPSGRIGSIYCAGVIGDPGASPPVKPVIEARDGINEIIAAEDGFSSMLVRDFFATVDAGKNSITPGFVDETFEEGYLTLLRTGGDYTGEVRAANILGAATTTSHRGILIGGVMTGAIDVEHCVFGADIIAESFTQPIDIGVHLRGSVIATDPVAGQIPEIEVGYADTPEAEQYAGRFVRGFTSVNIPPKDDAIALSDPARWFGPNADADGNVRFPRPYAFGSVDSIIRAASIGIVRLRSMTECSGCRVVRGRGRVRSPHRGRSRMARPFSARSPAFRRMSRRTTPISPAMSAAISAAARWGLLRFISISLTARPTTTYPIR